MQIEDMRLDGNAAGGALRDVFVRDVTAAMATCAGCRSALPLGALLSYGHGMGVVLRCPRCDDPMLRVVRVHGATYVDASGIALLVIPEDTPPS